MADVASTSVDESRAPGWRERLAALGLTPSKGLGQNFLHDRSIVRRIADGAGIRPDDTVLEIGPGLGILTEELAARAARVVAVELDARLARWLPDVMPGNVDVVEADALRIDPAQLVGGDYLVVANLPYSTGNAILRRMQEAVPPPRSLTIMLQREVAERMCAQPPEMSILAVAVQFYGTPSVLFRVGGGAFIPAPHVESAVVHIETHVPPLPADAHATFFRIVTAGFAQRRKQLLNSLSAGLRLHRDVITAALTDADIAPTLRPERLSIEEWVRMHAALGRYL